MGPVTGTGVPAPLETSVPTAGDVDARAFVAAFGAVRRCRAVIYRAAHPARGTLTTTTKFRGGEGDDATRAQ